MRDILNNDKQFPFFERPQRLLQGASVNHYIFRRLIVGVGLMSTFFTHNAFAFDATNEFGGDSSMLQTGQALIGARIKCTCSSMMDSSPASSTRSTVKLSIVRRGTLDLVWEKEDISVLMDSRCEIVTVVGNTTPLPDEILNGSTDDFWLRVDCSRGCAAKKQDVPFIMSGRGPKGDQGDRGLPGAKGDQGIKGADGLPGIPGAAGAPGADGKKGDKGDAGAAGPAGPIGPTGPTGPAGAKGDRGDAGVPGPAGATGPIGPSGPAGATGPTGSSGVQGPSGPAGAIGPIGLPGPQGLQGDKGRDGSQDVLFSQSDTGLVQVTTPQFTGRWLSEQSTTGLVNTRAPLQHSHSSREISAIDRCVGPVIAPLCANDDGSLRVQGVTFVPAPTVNGVPVKQDYVFARIGSPTEVKWNKVQAIGGANKQVLRVTGFVTGSDGLDVPVNTSLKMLVRVNAGYLEEKHAPDLNNSVLSLTVLYTGQ